MNFSTLDTLAFSGVPLFAIGTIQASSPVETVLVRVAAFTFPLTENFTIS